VYKVKAYQFNYNWITDIGILVKFKLSLMVIFSSLMAYAILSEGQINWQIFLLLFFGGLGVTFAANALNQALERDYDKLMERTANRPIANGRMNISMGVLISGIFCTIGVILLYFISSSAATLGMLSFVLYAFVYTPLKRYSTLAVPVGAIPGALPVLIAGVAAQGTLTIESLCLFGIQYLWQFPHYYSIAWLAHTDYSRAGFKLIKDFDGKPDPYLGIYGAIYAMMSLILIIPFYFLGELNLIPGLLLILTILVYTYYSFNLYKHNDKPSARQLMFCSIIYLPMMFIIFFINHTI
jgi:heme o synthase